MVNLVNNARDASAAGNEVLMAAHQADDQIKITVTDNGIGIPEAIRDRVSIHSSRPKKLAKAPDWDFLWYSA